MKLVLTAIPLITATTLLVSCSDDGAGAHDHESDSHSSHTASGTAENGLDGLEMNKGQKWKMDDHTRTVFAKMASSFLESKPLSLEAADLKKSGAGLQANIDELIQGCTMTGAAHDQLHVYLTGYIPAVSALAESGQIEDAEKVKRYLERYGQYFD